jgi:hypothetical protein
MGVDFTGWWLGLLRAWHCRTLMRSVTSPRSSAASGLCDGNRPILLLHFTRDESVNIRDNVVRQPPAA